MNKITTKRLVLRTLKKEDVTERYLRWLHDPMVNRFMETRFTKYSIDSCINYVESLNADSNNHLFGIFERTSKAHIGNIKLGFIKPTHKCGQLGLIIGERTCWGNGFGTEAIIAVTRWGFKKIGLERIEAGCYDGNYGSLRAFVKAGYSIEGHRRKAMVMGNRRVGCFVLGIVKGDISVN